LAKTIMASKFKEQCLALLDLVASTKVPIIVTKHGRPVAQLAPLDDVEPPRSTAGSVTLVAKNDEDYFSTGEAWHADDA
jgi:prevent-host-death family protein